MVLDLNFNHFTQFTIQNSTQFFQITFAIIFQLSSFKFINSSSSLGHHYHHLHPIASVFLVPLQNNSHSNYAGRMQQLLRDIVVHTVLVKLKKLLTLIQAQFQVFMLVQTYLSFQNTKQTVHDNFALCGLSYFYVAFL